ncbi:MAG: hypothetical protein WBH50_12475, partial [Fuerstiella sp.]
CSISGEAGAKLEPSAVENPLYLRRQDAAFAGADQTDLSLAGFGTVLKQSFQGKAAFGILRILENRGGRSQLV